MQNLKKKVLTLILVLTGLALFLPTTIPAYASGSTWSSMVSGTNEHLYSVGGSSPSDISAVSRSDTVLNNQAFDPWSYDTNMNGILSKAETLIAVLDYCYGTITRGQALAVVILYFS